MAHYEQLYHDLYKKISALADEWDKWAQEQVPPEYADRGLHGKFLRGDNIAAGYSECADALRDALTPKGDFRKAQGIIPWKEGDELPEDAIRRLRDAD